MKYQNQIPKDSGWNLNIYPLHYNSSSVEPTSEDRKTRGHKQEKSQLQKYINLYESIEQRQSLKNHQPNNESQILSIRKVISHQKGIFENPFIRKSCSQSSYQRNIPFKQFHPQKLTNPSQFFKKNSTKNKRNPSKKNELNLRIIAEHKFFKDSSVEKQSSNFTNEFQNHHQKDINKENGLTFYSSDDDFTENYQNKTFNNTFLTVQKGKKLYQSYHKSKNNKFINKSSQKRFQKSQEFINEVNQFIENQKYKNQVIRPHTANLKNYSKQNINKSIHNFIINDQSQGSKTKNNLKETPLKNQIKSSENKNQSLSKNFKRYFFQKKYHQPLKGFSYHPDDQKQNRKNICNLSITTQTPKNRSFFITQKNQNLCKSIKIDSWFQTKKILKKKYIGNSKMADSLHQKSSKNTSLNHSKVQKETSHTALNKIQNCIENDLQISIRQLDSTKL